MLFPTLDYFVFLPLVAAVHWVLRSNGLRTTWLLLVSLVFYAAWNPLDTLLLLTVVTTTFFGARWVDLLQGPRRQVVAGTFTVLILSPLLYYKYTRFLLENLQAIFPEIPVQGASHLPIGISFYSFQAIGYLIDVYRGQKPENNPVRFTTFLLFFPHLVAGPILRASVLLAQLSQVRTLSRSDVGHGVVRLCVGLVKKILIADVLRLGIVDTVFTDPEMFTGLEILVALYAYTLEIYCDFSGYTDFAIGSARLFGLHIPENFQRPYQALSVGDYWRRWHITLSDWVRDYVYYPMGGSRVGGWKVYRNTFLTLLILAIWHGANWTFVLYGFIHGSAVSLNRWWRKRQTEERPLSWFGISWRWVLTFHFVVLARILFRADDMAQARQLVAGLAHIEWVMPRFSLHAWAVLIIGYLLHLSPQGWSLAMRERFSRLPAPVQGILLAGVAWACMEFGPGDTLTFIYYAF